MSTMYGYARVSSVEQNEDRQMIALKKAGVSDSHIFMDKQSGKDFHRENYEKWKRPYGDIYCGFGAVDTFFCGRERKGKYTETTGTRDCSGEKARCSIWQAGI